MTVDVIAELVGGRLRNPDGSGNLLVPTRLVVIEPSLVGAGENLLQRAGFTGSVLVVADAATWAACGAGVYESCRAAGQPTDKMVFPADVRPTLEAVQQIEAAAGAVSGLVAVGSGTINDLTKYAAFRSRKPYVVFATAASMNGYTSVNASITENGHKKTVGAAAPVAAFFDLGVLAAAPARLTRSGVGDSLCRSTAQTDWLLSHRLFGTPYRSAPFNLLRTEEDALLARVGDLHSGSIDAMRHLARTLILSGFGMTICGGSHPASQGEHLISHFLDMFEDPTWPVAFHGEHVAVTTLTMARLQASLLAKGTLKFEAMRPTAAELETRFGNALGASFWREYERKIEMSSSPDAARRLTECWPELRRELTAIHRSPQIIERDLVNAGAPTSPADIGIPDLSYRKAVCHARLIRDRYTFLDLAADTGNSGLLDVT